MEIISGPACHLPQEVLLPHISQEACDTYDMRLSYVRAEIWCNFDFISLT